MRFRIRILENTCAPKQPLIAFFIGKFNSSISNQPPLIAETHTLIPQEHT